MGRRDGCSIAETETTTGDNPIDGNGDEVGDGDGGGGVSGREMVATELKRKEGKVGLLRREEENENGWGRRRMFLGFFF